MYVEPEEVGLPKPAYHIRHLIVSVRREIPTFHVVDLEAFLDSPFETVVVNGQDETVTVVEVIATVANTESSHYDPGVPLHIDRLRSQVYLDIDVVDRVIPARGLGAGASQLRGARGDGLVREVNSPSAIS